MTSAPKPSPVLSVIVPARNCKGDLRLCLENLDRSEFEDYEVIVVDDASTDDTITAVTGDRVRVVALPDRLGPAAARNRGAKVARGEILLFVDADVCVRPETLGLVVAAFRADPTAAAVFGSYDTQPFANNILSQYRNLMHHYVHQQSCEEAGTFWTGCGAVRRAVFREAGGFDERYDRPCIEDIEFGVRLRTAGHRIVLDKRIQVCHLKKWTFWGMLKADVRDRAYPWSRLIFRERYLPNDLNLRLSQRVSAILSLGLLISLAVAVWHLELLLLLPVACLVLMLLLDAWSDNRRVPDVVRYFGVLSLFAAGVGMAVAFHELVLIPFAFLAGIVVLNWRFYAFLARRRHPLYAVYAVPFQILYFLYSAGTFAAAGVIHFAHDFWTGGKADPATTPSPGASGPSPAGHEPPPPCTVSLTSTSTR